ncbi:DUF167 domain-containing protein [Phenylobacterium sp.]|uniref:DUF167 domain-containing protein n=1 Tax=Phenylobacterium sp. TaxID=1871053 RepID=UPI0008CC76BA|nr:DUF167 domain-containing protein [Phenylobacterium sp.]MBC7167879.1 DUF167 domain-containing protein [Phenylobacterium sp.]OHB34160.1 MAG: hypothetical protein A2882_11815 [Phenylobacterium sp. RIFCSPHIGHO2_01_FULL_70_10]
MRLAVRLTPKGGRDAAEGWAADGEGRPYLKVRVSAPPVDGAANAALISFLAKTLKRPRASVRIVSGETSRLKMIEIEDLSDEALAAAFGPRP